MVLKAIANKRTDVYRSIPPRRCSNNSRGRGSIRVSAKQRFLDAKRRLRKVQYIAKESRKSDSINPSADPADAAVIEELGPWFDHIKSREKVVRLKIGYEQFKNAQKGDFYVQCLQKDIYIKKWINVTDEMITKHIAAFIGYKQTNERLRAIAMIGFGRSESFVDVYSDYIESSVPITEKCLDYVGFKQLMKKYAPSDISDFDFKAAWSGMTETGNHAVITKQQWRNYKQEHLTPNYHQENMIVINGKVEDAAKESLEEMNFTQFKKLYYKHVTGQNAKNLFELRQYWRENLKGEQTGTITRDQWIQFAEVC